jgi:hypothetical protein
LLLQSPKPVAHAPIAHTPSTHWFAATLGAPLHRAPHAPQCSGSVRVDASQPFASSPSQSSKPGMHEDSVQRPPTQRPDAFANAQSPASRHGSGTYTSGASPPSIRASLTDCASPSLAPSTTLASIAAAPSPAPPSPSTGAVLGLSRCCCALGGDEQSLRSSRHVPALRVAHCGSDAHCHQHWLLAQMLPLGQSHSDAHAAGVTAGTHTFFSGELDGEHRYVGGQSRSDRHAARHTLDEHTSGLAQSSLNKHSRPSGRFATHPAPTPTLSAPAHTNTNAHAPRGARFIEDGIEAPP